LGQRPTGVGFKPVVVPAQRAEIAGCGGSAVVVGNGVVEVAAMSGQIGDTVLMVLNGQRGQWELPGGMLERGETARQAAERELAEETGIWTTDLDFAAIVEFDLRQPARREYAAVYRAELHIGPQLIVNDEALGIRWWDPHSSLSEDMSPLDAEIGRRLMEGPTQ
jgi:8-oxo-dGTP diphosphatase